MRENVTPCMRTGLRRSIAHAGDDSSRCRTVPHLCWCRPPISALSATSPGRACRCRKAGTGGAGRPFARESDPPCIAPRAVFQCPNVGPSVWDNNPTGWIEYWQPVFQCPNVEPSVWDRPIGPFCPFCALVCQTGSRKSLPTGRFRGSSVHVRSQVLAAGESRLAEDPLQDAPGPHFDPRTPTPSPPCSPFPGRSAPWSAIVAAGRGNGSRTIRLSNCIGQRPFLTLASRCSGGSRSVSGTYCRP